MTWKGLKDFWKTVVETEDTKTKKEQSLEM